LYTNTYSTVAGCDSIVNFNVTITGVIVQAKACLSGPLSGTLMNDNLRALNLLPTTEPYGSLNTTNNPYTPVYSHVAGGGGEVTTAAVLGVTGPNAIVDWVFLSLRDASNSANVVATRSALLQRDGDIVDVDGISPVVFNSPVPGNYFVAVKHRNHVGVMTAAAQALSATPATVDYTAVSTALFTKAAPQNNASPLSGPTRIIGGKRALYAGNANITSMFRNSYISYDASQASDRAGLLNATGATGTISGYSVFDVDMNGSARFNGLTPDRLVILNNCNNSNTIIVYEQLP
jgi:hypothetical protein